MTTTMHRPATVAARTSLLDDAMAIVETDYASDLSIEEVAQRICTSRRQLQRAYAEIGDTTFRDHLTAVRLGRAAEILASGDRPVRDVAHAVGYRQAGQFAKAFRRQHGLGPTEFRAVRRSVATVRADDLGRVRIVLDGPVDAPSVPALRALLQTLAARKRTVLLDISRRPKVDLAGRELLENALRDAGRDGWRLQLVR